MKRTLLVGALSGKISNLFSLRTCLSIIFFGLLQTTFAQQVSIKSLELLSNGDINIYYDLEDEQEDRKYALYLYASSDNYIQPLGNVEGEIGVDISLGRDKKIVWHAKEALGSDYKGTVALELKGNVYVPFISLDGFDDYKVFKRGKTYDISWTGGRGDNILNFELYNGNEKVMQFDEKPNVGNASLVFPKDVKPGEYRFKISDSRNRDEVVFTNNFQVKRKVPLIVPIAAGVVVGAIVGVLVATSVSSNDEEPQIGEPPTPQGN